MPKTGIAYRLRKGYRQNAGKSILCLTSQASPLLQLREAISSGLELLAGGFLVILQLAKLDPVSRFHSIAAGIDCEYPL